MIRIGVSTKIGKVTSHADGADIGPAIRKGLSGDSLRKVGMCQLVVAKVRKVELGGPQGEGRKHVAPVTAVDKVCPW